MFIYYLLYNDEPGLALTLETAQFANTLPYAYSPINLGLSAMRYTDITADRSPIGDPASGKPAT